MRWIHDGSPVELDQILVCTSSPDIKPGGPLTHCLYPGEQGHTPDNIHFSQGHGNFPELFDGYLFSDYRCGSINRPDC